MHLILFINIFVWTYVIFFLFQGKKIKYEMGSGNAIITLILFVTLGIIQFIHDPNKYSLITLFSIILAGILYGYIPSGVTSEGLMILGRSYHFDKIKSIEYVINHDRLEVTFIYKHRTYFLFKEKEKEDEVRDVIKKYQKEAKRND